MGGDQRRDTMTESHDDGYWEELSYVWMSDFPYPDDAETYEKLNYLLPSDLSFVVIRGEDPRVSLMKYYDE